MHLCIFSRLVLVFLSALRQVPKCRDVYLLPSQLHESLDMSRYLGCMYTETLNPWTRVRPMKKSDIHALMRDPYCLAESLIEPYSHTVIQPYLCTLQHSHTCLYTHCACTYTLICCLRCCMCVRKAAWQLPSILCFVPPSSPTNHQSSPRTHQSRNSKRLGI